LERFGLPLSTWDNEDWPRLMRAVEAMAIQQTETLRIQQTQGLIEGKHISPAQWAKFAEHDQIVAEAEQDEHGLN
jgi:hypothetical protein